MNFLIMGLPGVGKGTQADKIVEKYGVAHLSTGNMFREIMSQDTTQAKELKEIVDSGNLVPDELTIKLLKQEIEKPKYVKGFLLDGFPRTINQAESLDAMLKAEGLKLDAVLSLDLDEEVIISRLEGRLVCPKDGSSYHKTLVPPKEEGICDVCGGDLVQREDDTRERIVHRMSVAKENTLPVVEYYEKQGVVKTISINENDSTDEVFAKIVSVIS